MCVEVVCGGVVHVLCLRINGCFGCCNSFWWCFVDGCCCGFVGLGVFSVASVVVGRRCVCMKPRIKIAESTTPDGGPMGLYVHDGEYSISFKGQELMHSEASASELLLGELGVERLQDGSVDSPRVMVGGLGLGFTLKSTLAGLGAGARVDVYELVERVVDWNREFLGDLNGGLLEDSRVRVEIGDAVRVIRKGHPNTYDAMILDVDNGPTGMVKASNNSLYSHNGLRAVRRMLKPWGRAVFWSAGEDPHFKARLQTCGFRVGVVPAKVHVRAKRAAYRIYVADRGFENVR